MSKVETRVYVVGSASHRTQRNTEQIKKHRKSTPWIKEETEKGNENENKKGKDNKRRIFIYIQTGRIHNRLIEVCNALRYIQEV